jgi:hypothetical protein
MLVMYGAARVSVKLRRQCSRKLTNCSVVNLEFAQSFGEARHRIASPMGF